MSVANSYVNVPSVANSSVYFPSVANSSVHVPSVANSSVHAPSVANVGPDFSPSALNLEQGEIDLGYIDDIYSEIANNLPMDAELQLDLDLINQLTDAEQSSSPLVRTISSVTDTKGPPPKRTNRDLGAIFEVIKDASMPSGTNTIPTTFNQAMKSPDVDFWNKAIAKELEAHAENHTWDIVELPSHKRAIGCRWVFNIKDNINVPLFKARLVAQGFRQVQGVDYGETFSPVIRYESIRILFAIAAQFKLVIHQMDVTTVFLNGDLQEEIYMKIPDGVDAPDNMVCRLRKSLYGLKQAPLCWNMKINDLMLSAGFKRSLSEFGLYSKIVNAEVVLVALYVDDLLILSNNMALINQVKLLLNSSFKMKDLGLVNTFLGMEISQNSNGISLHLNKYLNNMLQEFGMNECNAVSTPLPSNINSIDDGLKLSESDATVFRSMVGKLLFAANTVRTDLAFAASYLSRFIKEPYSKHLSACKHTLRYVKGTTKLGLIFSEGNKFELVGYCDADWAGDKR